MFLSYTSVSHPNGETQTLQLHVDYVALLEYAKTTARSFQKVFDMPLFRPLVNPLKKQVTLFGVK